MPWLAPVVGYVTERGELRCSDCEDEGVPVHGDQWFGEDDVCERCGKQLEHVRISGYVHVSW